MNHLTDADRADAAVQLRVPMSGISELDAMIRESRRLDMATAAMKMFGEVLSDMPCENEEAWDSHISERSMTMADALLAASEPERKLNSEPTPKKD